MHYAANGEVSLAYQTFGTGSVDLVLVTGWVLPMETAWDEPGLERFLNRLGRFARVIIWDKRGTGLSDRVAPREIPTLDERIEDLTAVIEAAGVERPNVFGISEGVPFAIEFAARRPELLSSLMLYGGWALTMADDQHPWAFRREAFDRFVETVRQNWEQPAPLLRLWAPTAIGDQAFTEWWARSLRIGASPATAETWLEMMRDFDVRESLGQIKVPTLVLHRKDDRLVKVENSRFIAAGIPDSRLVEVEGADHLWWVGDADSILEPIEELVTGMPARPAPDRFLTTVLFTDIVDSTRLLSDRGDRRWRDTIAVHDRRIREILPRYGGVEIKTLGDGFMARFESPTQAIRAAQAMRATAYDLDLEIRAGLHTGEVERMGDDISGIAVNIGARIGALAAAGEILASQTVADLVAGSDVEFESYGEHELKGVPGRRPILAVRS